MRYLVIFLVFNLGCNQQTELTQNSVKTFDNPAQKNSSLPYLSNHPEGLLFSWVQMQGDSASFKYAVMSNGEWENPTTISSGMEWFVNWADYPMAVSNSSGQVLAHNLIKSGPDTYSYDVHLFLQDLKSRNQFMDFIPHNDKTKTEHGFVTSLPLDSGFLISWLDGRNTVVDQRGLRGAMTLRSMMIGNEGKKSSDLELDGSTCDCCQTTGVITPEGPVIFYRDRSSLEIRDIYFVRQRQGIWSKPKPVHRDNWKIDGCPVNGPRADFAEGTIGIAWFTAAGGLPLVKVSFSTDFGNTFSNPILINEENTLGRVDFVMIDDVSGAVSWVESTESATFIYIRRVNLNGTMGTPIKFSKMDNSRQSGFPQIARVKETIFIAWTGIENENSEILTASLGINEL